MNGGYRCNTNASPEPTQLSDRDYFYVSGNVVADPQFTDHRNHDYRVGGLFGLSLGLLGTLKGFP